MRRRPLDRDRAGQGGRRALVITTSTASAASSSSRPQVLRLDRSLPRRHARHRHRDEARARVRQFENVRGLAERDRARRLLRRKVGVLREGTTPSSSRRSCSSPPARARSRSSSRATRCGRLRAGAFQTLVNRIWCADRRLFIVAGQRRPDRATTRSRPASRSSGCARRCPSARGTSPQGQTRPGWRSHLTSHTIVAQRQEEVESATIAKLDAAGGPSPARSGRSLRHDPGGGRPRPWTSSSTRRASSASRHAAGTPRRC